MRPKYKEVVQFYKRHGIIKTMDEYDITYNMLARWCKHYKVPMKESDYKKYMKQENDWLKNVPSTLEEARKLNWKPNRQRLRNYWYMIKDYNRASPTQKNVGKTYATPLQLKYR